MKKILLQAALLLTACGPVMAANNGVDRADQVLMTIDNKPVTLGEFEYLYHKNNSQQLVPQSINEYLEMFINYKLKVAEAEAAGIDTTAAFVSELNGYARDLAQPYLVDSVVERQLIDKAYSRMNEEVNVSHIMLFTGETPEQREANRNRLDSLRNVIISGKSTFEEVAEHNSIDASSNKKGGNMGYIVPNRLPYTFEDAAYETPVGQMSEIVETPFGIHLVKPVARHTSRGQILTQHILKLTADVDAARAAVKRAQIDSIHALLVAGADFDDMAARESEDPGSARQGGRLPWFSAGMMVMPFSEAAFSLRDGELSDVVETDFGYHIIKRLDSKPVASKEESIGAIKQALARDQRGQLPRKARLDEFKKRYNLIINRPAMAMVESVIRSNGGYDSTVIAKLADMPAMLARFDGGDDILLTQVIPTLSPMNGLPADRAYGIFSDRVNAMIDEAITDRAIADLPTQNAEYGNLLKEYRDGILLFDISDRNVWSRAKEDTAGLDKWFNDHRDRYKWNAPKFKSYIIFATSDSVLSVARGYLAANPAIEGKDLVSELGKVCGRNVRVERVIAAQGENAIVDYLGFDGPRPTPTGRWVAYEAYRPAILDAPAEVADERGAVTADYQASLEESWLKQLHKKHKVKVNKKVLKQAQ